MKPLLSYRSRLRLKRIALTLLCILLAAIVVVVGIVIYLERYVVYTDTEAYLSFLHDEIPTDTTLLDPGSDFPMILTGESIERPDTDIDAPLPGEVSPDAIRGVYLSYSDLQQPEACLEAIEAVEECNTVLLQLKSNAGNFYYGSNFSTNISTSVDPDAVNELIRTLSGKGYHLIARVAAFPDTAWALENLSSGLQLSNGALWMDAEGYYWLNPSDMDVQQHLCSLALELNELGVDEIAFTGFLFPESENIAYGDLDEVGRVLALNAAAGMLIDLGAEHGFAVSFCDPIENSPSPSADGHVLLSEVEGAQAAVAEETYRTMISGAGSLIFLTDSRDTRFEPYGILRSVELE